jgi:hypothetical protein
MATGHSALPDLFWRVLRGQKGHSGGRVNVSEERGRGGLLERLM